MTQSLSGHLTTFVNLSHVQHRYNIAASSLRHLPKARAELAQYQLEYTFTQWCIAHDLSYRKDYVWCNDYCDSVRVESPQMATFILLAWS